jgi:ATP-dependent Clp protease ATP-binding subunit ClpA
MGFGKQAEDTEEYNKTALSKIIGAEIYDIVNEVIVFNQLNKEDLEKIYENNLEEYLEPYKVGIDKDELKKLVLDNSSTGHDIINKLSSEIPKLVFKKLQGDVNESK